MKLSASSLTISIADAPAGLLEIVTAGNSRVTGTRGQKPVGTQDHPIYKNKSVAWLEGLAPEAIEGAGGDEATYRVAAQLKDFGISESRAFELMIEHWNETKAIPPWSPEDLETKVANAYRYGTGAPGKSTAEADFGIRLAPIDGDENAAVSNPLDDYDIGTPPSREAIAAAQPKALAQSKPASGFFTLPMETHIENVRRKPGKMLVAGFIQEGWTGVLFSPSGLGKSAITLCLSCAVSSGGLWAGRETTKGSVLYVAAEGAPGTGLRAAAWKKVHGGSLDNLEIAPCTFALNQKGMVGEIVAAIGDVEKRTGFPVRLVVFDTVAQTIENGKEDPSDMNTYSNCMAQIRDRTGAAVLAIHHPRKDDESIMRGGGSLHNNVDFVFRIASGKNKPRRIIATKLKDGDPSKIDIAFRLETVGLGESVDGYPVESIVPVYPDENDLEPIPLSPNDERLFDCLKELAGEDGRQPVGTADLKAAYWASIDPEWQPGDDAPPGYSDRSVEAQIKNLVEAGWAIRAQKGRYLPA